MEHDRNILMIFGIKENVIILTHTIKFLAITTNILQTAFVLQGHVWEIYQSGWENGVTLNGILTLYQLMKSFLNVVVKFCPGREQG